jgi:hypothetical protein
METVIFNGYEYELITLYNEIEKDFGQVEVTFEIWSTQDGYYIVIGRYIDYSKDKDGIFILSTTRSTDEFEDIVNNFELHKHYKPNTSEEDTI